MKTLLLAVALVGCGGTWISPQDAYTAEVRQCDAKTDENARRGCMNMVRNKYGRWLGEGGYPAPGSATPGPTTGRIAGH